MPDIDIRSAIKYAKSHLGSNLKCAEIGVRDGHHSLGILNTLDVEHLYLIDGFSPYLDGEEYYELNTQIQHLKNLISNLSPKEIAQKTTLILKDSHYALHLFPDDYFDFVYIDANHDYYNARHDIEGWFNKVKVGGILSGHDFNLVYNAVNGFVCGNPESCTEFIAFPDTDWVIFRRC